MAKTYLVIIGYLAEEEQLDKYMTGISTNLVAAFEGQILKTEREGPKGNVVGKFWLAANKTITEEKVQRLCFPDDDRSNPNPHSITDMIYGYGNVLSVDTLDDDGDILRTKLPVPESPNEYAIPPREPTPTLEALAV